MPNTNSQTPKIFSNIFYRAAQSIVSAMTAAFF